MVRYDHKILNVLLDSYENSLLSIGENKRKIHIDFVFTQRAIPEYFDESSLAYETIHVCMQTLEEKDFLQIIWKNGRQGHQIERVRLQVDSIDEMYAFLHRTPKNELERKAITLLTQYRQELSSDEKAVDCTAYRFAEYLLLRIQNHQTVKEYVDLAKSEAMMGLLQAIRAVEQNQKSCYIREFSVRCFRDSKYFEQIEQQVAKVLTRFQDTFAGMETDEILAEYGIYHTPNYVYFKGQVQMMVGQELIHLKALHQGIGLSGEDIPTIRFEDLSEIKRVLTIENLTTFFRWQEPDCLIVYLGGYHNAIRRQLLQAIYREIPQAQYCHFGDIDAGGFAILRDLQKKTGIPFQAYYMDEDTLKQYEKYGKRLTASDRKRLAVLATEEPQWRETIQYMLEADVKLEQECVLP